MKDFEKNLERLEELTSDIKRQDISLEDALKDFEEGITLAKGLEKELENIEGKIQILMSEPNPANPDVKAQLDLFEIPDAPDQGTR